ncbi:MAG TPA: hypothetical protein VMM60_12725 [Ilumatobacter sp.]|nr:hypothetical protein [Ilumatobacter sp.]
MALSQNPTSSRRGGNTAVIHATFNELTHQLNILECAPSNETVNLDRQLVGRRC